jgi:phospholipase/lecithinase/hemolysin
VLLCDFLCLLGFVRLDYFHLQLFFMTAGGSKRPPVREPRRWLTVCPAILFAFTAVLASAQNYTSIVVFGDSLSDTGNVADLSEAKYGVRIPGPFADYTDGRFTDGTDTVPAAINYNGVWIEQLAAMLPARPAVKASLDGGTNYAYGFAKTGNGTGVLTFGPGDSLSVTVNNIGQQITDYLGTKPKVNAKTLYVIWGGANDLLNATSNKDVIDAAINQAINIQRLIEAGATQFIVPNLPPLGAVPRLNGSPTTSIPATEASILYNDTLKAGLDIVLLFNARKHISLYQFDVFSLIDKIIASPKKYLLANVTDSSQEMAVNPDTYLFWDDLHPTTRGHNILATTAIKGLAPGEVWAKLEAYRLTVPAGVTVGK